jgi:4-amino-4-deoxy-L-arabinose transferase-like glycosyltransferase
VNQNTAIGVVAILGALILFGRKVLARQRRGARSGRYAVIWAVIFTAAFAFATWHGRHG